MTIDERMTICNMSIEGGARSATSTPTTRRSSSCAGGRSRPGGDAFEHAVAWWRQMASDRDAATTIASLRRRDDRADGHLGDQPGQSVGVASDRADAGRRGAGVHGVQAGRACRARDRRRVHRLVHQRPPVGSRGSGAHRQGHHVAPHVKALVVPGSRAVSRAAEARGLHEVFIEAGFEWRGAGCSMCLGMNPDKLEGRQISASSSNRNFKGRQGSPTGRTLLMSPAMVAAAAIAGEVVDVREMLDAVPA
jgi:3-isopropylmalate/(R)-2-methylmalate dehydratase large subunit